MRIRTSATVMLLASLAGTLPPRPAQAGPLLDWLCCKNRAPTAPAIPVGPTYAVGMVPYAAAYAPAPYATGYAPYVAGYAPVAPAGYSAAMPITSVPVTNGPITSGYGYAAQRPLIGGSAVVPVAPAMPTPVSLVPDYRSTFNRTPVTYYRPVLTTDPTTGAQVVTLSPCTSYEYQTQRVPTLGLTQVFNGGATLPASVVPTGPSAPLLTVPRGGVQLAGPLPSTDYSTAYGAYPATLPSTSATLRSGSVITPAAPPAGSTYALSPYSTGYPSTAVPGAVVPGTPNNYGSYSALQPGYSAPTAGAYATAPYGTTPSGTGSTYSGGCTGGGASSGSYIPSVPPSTFTPAQPGFSAPPAIPFNGSGIVPGNTTTPVYPGPSSVMPPSYTPAPAAGSVPGGFSPVLPSQDPNANVPPSFSTPGLPPMQSGARLDAKPQLRGVVREPLPNSNNRTVQSAGSPNSGAPRTSGSSPATNSSLMPIPLPKEFESEPRWNPGLLSEQDQTAAKATDSAATRTATQPADAYVHGGYKPIQWASFHASGKPVVDSKPEVDAVEPAVAIRNANGNELQLGKPITQPKSGVRAIERPRSERALPLTPAPRDAAPQVATPQATQRQLRPSVERAAGPGDLLIGSTPNVEMVPLDPTPLPQAPVTSRPLADSELLLSSPGISQPTPAAQPTPTAQPTTVPPVARSRYNTGGWQKAN